MSIKVTGKTQLKHQVYIKMITEECVQLDNIRMVKVELNLNLSYDLNDNILVKDLSGYNL